MVVISWATPTWLDFVDDTEHATRTCLQLAFFSGSMDYTVWCAFKVAIGHLVRVIRRRYSDATTERWIRLTREEEAMMRASRFVRSLSDPPRPAVQEDAPPAPATPPSAQPSTPAPPPAAAMPPSLPSCIVTPAPAGGSPLDASRVVRGGLRPARKGLAEPRPVVQAQRVRFQQPSPPRSVGPAVGEEKVRVVENTATVVAPVEEPKRTGAWSSLESGVAPATPRPETLLRAAVVAAVRRQQHRLRGVKRAGRASRSPRVMAAETGVVVGPRSAMPQVSSVGAVPTPPDVVSQEPLPEVMVTTPAGDYEAPVDGPQGCTWEQGMVGEAAGIVPALYISTDDGDASTVDQDKDMADVLASADADTQGLGETAEAVMEDVAADDDDLAAALLKYLEESDDEAGTDTWGFTCSICGAFEAFDFDALVAEQGEEFCSMCRLAAQNVEGGSATPLADSLYTGSATGF